jgi:hypothetical protein
MRIVEIIPHQTFKISLFVTEKEFVLQFEAGPMIQTYKYSKDIYPSALEVKQAINDVFLDKVHDLFNEMFLNRKSMIDA